MAMKKRWICCMVLILGLVFITGCGRKAGRSAKEDAIPVRIMKVRLKTLDKALEYVGNIIGQNEAMVYPKVGGKIIEKVKEDGSPISKGEVIVYIDRDEIGLKFEKAPVESPLDGVVGRVYVDIGSSVTPQTPVALVTDMTRAQINLDIPEKYLPRVSIGQNAEVIVDAYPDDKFMGKVTKVSPIVDTSTRGAPIEIMIDNADAHLQSGMFAKVRVIIDQNIDVPTILKEAVLGKMSDTYVYVVDGNMAHLRKVALGIRHGPYYEVLDGLKEGDLVVIMGQQRLRDGAIVKAEE